MLKQAERFVMVGSFFNKIKFSHNKKVKMMNTLVRMIHTDLLKYFRSSLEVSN